MHGQQNIKKIGMWKAGEDNYAHAQCAVTEHCSCLVYIIYA